MGNKYRYVATLILAAIEVSTYMVEAVDCSFSASALGAVVTKHAQQDANRMKRELLGPYHEIKSLTADNIGHAYMVFVENVRDKKENWTDSDWNKAQAVMEQLDKQYTTIYLMLKVGDKARIRSLQEEFRKLQEKNMVKR